MYVPNYEIANTSADAMLNIRRKSARFTVNKH